MFQLELKNAYIGEVWTPTSNTVLYLPLDNDTKDYGPNGYNGTGSNITYTELSSGLKVASFNGSSSRITTSNIGTLANNWTFLYWVYVIDCENYASCITKGSATSTRHLLQMGFRETSSANPRKPVIGFYGDDFTTGSSITLSQWILMAYTYEYSTRTRKVYQNGTLLGSNVASGQYDLGSGGLYIGSRPYSNSGGDGGYQWFNGRMSKIIGENKIRTVDEISHYFDLTKSNYGL